MPLILFICSCHRVKWAVLGYFKNIIKGGSHNVSFNFHFEFRFNFVHNWWNLRVPIPLEDRAYSLGPAKSSDFITTDIGYMIISDELSILNWMP